MKVKSELVDVSETYRLAEELGVELIPVTGEQGLIGALAALAFCDSPEEAVKVYA